MYRKENYRNIDYRSKSSTNTIEKDEKKNNIITIKPVQKVKITPNQQ